MAAAIIPDYIEDFVSRSSDDKMCLVSTTSPVKVGSKEVDQRGTDVAGATGQLSIFTAKSCANLALL